MPSNWRCPVIVAGWKEKVYPKNALTHPHTCICIVVHFHFYSIRCDLFSLPSRMGAVRVCMCTYVFVSLWQWVGVCACVCKQSHVIVVILFFNIHTPIRREIDSLCRYRCATLEERQTLEHTSYLRSCVCATEECWCWHTGVYECITIGQHNRMHTKKQQHELTLADLLPMLTRSCIWSFTGTHAYILLLRWFMYYEELMLCGSNLCLKLVETIRPLRRLSLFQCTWPAPTHSNT